MNSRKIRQLLLVLLLLLLCCFLTTRVQQYRQENQLLQAYQFQLDQDLRMLIHLSTSLLDEDSATGSRNTLWNLASLYREMSIDLQHFQSNQAQNWNRVSTMLIFDIAGGDLSEDHPLELTSAQLEMLRSLDEENKHLLTYLQGDPLAQEFEKYLFDHFQKLHDICENYENRWISRA